MNELKPCPFCGGSAVSLKKIEPRLHRTARNRLYSVVCWECDLYLGYDEDYGGRFYTDGEAISAWNTRVGQLLQQLKTIIVSPGTDECEGCAFEDRKKWEGPCWRCKRNCKDYWRRRGEQK